jgi:hypothetical protein
MNTLRFLYHVKKIATLSSDYVTESALKLNQDNPAHIGGIDLIGFEAFHIVYKKRKMLYKPFSLLAKNKMLPVLYSNLYIALRIVLTSRVLGASAEGSFTKLKPVKSCSYLCSTMSQERLAGRATLSFKSELSLTLGLETVTDDFVHKP